MWERILAEIKSAERLILYAEADDFPLKGALVEVGMALALGIRVECVLPGVVLEKRSMRPLGSWANHPLVRMWQDGTFAAELLKGMRTYQCLT